MSLDAPPPPASPPESPRLPEQGPAAGAETMRLSWSPPPGMVALSFKNFALKIITLGIYNFWGKTEVRRRIWSAVRLNGEPLQYNGTGKEMFLGFLVVMGLLTIPALLVSLGAMVVFGPKSRIPDAFQAIFTVFIFFLIGVGTHKATRYRMTRTRWRGIRGGLEGSPWSYGSWYFWTGALMILTLGWISPWRSTKLQSMITNGMRFGNRPFTFDAKAGPLYTPFAVLWLSAVVIAVAAFGLIGVLGWRMQEVQKTLKPGQVPDMGSIIWLVVLIYAVIVLGFLLYGVMSAWYRAQMMNHFAAHTKFEGAQFSANATGRSLIMLTVTNWLMVIFTFGLLAPVAQARSARYFVEHLQLEGNAALGAILQRAEDESKSGEGLAQAFDIDAF